MLNLDELEKIVDAMTPGEWYCVWKDAVDGYYAEEMVVRFKDGSTCDEFGCSRDEDTQKIATAMVKKGSIEQQIAHKDIQGIAALRNAITAVNDRFDQRAAQLEARRTAEHDAQHHALAEALAGLSRTRTGVEPHLVDVTAARTWLVRNGHPDPGVTAVNVDCLVHVMLCNALARLTTEWRRTEVKTRTQLELAERTRRRVLGPLADQLCRAEQAQAALAKGQTR